MKNKTVIRKKNTKGKFTTIHHSIINDTRLTPTAFKLIVLILSDSDDKFDLSRTLYINRLGVSEPTFDKALQVLIECGYIRVEKLKNRIQFNHYTISEYGNLTPTKEEPKLLPKEETPSIDISVPEPIKEADTTPIDTEEIAEVTAWVIDKISKLTMYGTIKEKEVGTKQIIDYMLKQYYINKNSVSENLIKKRVVYYNNRINANKTANINQAYQQ